MKYEQKTNNTGKTNHYNTSQNQVDKNHLYNLLYAGRITLKEYLQKVKVLELENAEA
ncbi:hypothetical protein HRG84_15630 [Flavisolibacter sp. BT320]|nr:hypothetical protein [Flavisolibacter longurius]